MLPTKMIIHFVIRSLMLVCLLEIRPSTMQNCPDFVWGPPDCYSLCDSGCLDYLCDAATGICNDCEAGSTGDYCDEGCPATYYGQRCIGRCSSYCVNRICNSVNGKCDRCVPGKSGDMCYADCPQTTYGQDCKQRCSTNCKDQLCNPVTGSCNQCPPGKRGNACDQDCPYPTYGQNCDNTCSTNCAGQRCDLASGICFQCVPGKTTDMCDQNCSHPKYGQDCLETCSTNCVDQRCNPVNGKCDQCPPGKIGDFCDQDCPIRTYGQDCLKTCSNNCADQRCNAVNGTCDQCPSGKTGDLCDQDCQAIYYGPRCTQLCNTNCLNRLCDKVTGICEQCPPGKVGNQCERDCPDTFYGAGCAQVCSSNCVDQACDKVTGACDMCPSGKTGEQCDQDCQDFYYGVDCREQCNTNCVDRLCDKVTGVCIQCLQGKTGDQCDQDTGPDCPPTYYGENCESRCSTTCVDQLCDEVNGTCNQCPGRKKGDQCDIDCSPTTYGPRCSKTCSVKCLNQHCDRRLGVCLQCPDRFSGDQCDQELCPLGFCKNGGRCPGLYLCDCRTTGFYGDTCQYTREEIPVNHYRFINISMNNTVVTSYGNLPFSGQVEVVKNEEDSVMTVPAGSYVNIDELLKKCLQNIDNCKSGFSITNTHSFSPVDKEGTNIVITTGAGLEDGVRGVSLYYQSGYVYCYVVTSTHVWSIVRPFNLVESEWYEMTVSWHPGQGLVLLQGNNVIGSNTTSTPLATEATVSKPLLIGSSGGTSSRTVMIVRELITVPVFWKEVQRSTILFTKETSSGDSPALEMAQIIGIAVGCFVALVFAVVAVVWIISYRRKRSAGKSPQSDGPKTDDGYLTPVDNAYSMNTTNVYSEYNSDGNYENTASDYDYIKDDYITVEPDDTLSNSSTVPRRTDD